jgi:hypothetical protein
MLSELYNLSTETHYGSAGNWILATKVLDDLKLITMCVG